MCMHGSIHGEASSPCIFFWYIFIFLSTSFVAVTVPFSIPHELTIEANFNSMYENWFFIFGPNLQVLLKHHKANIKFKRMKTEFLTQIRHGRWFSCRYLEQYEFAQEIPFSFWFYIRMYPKISCFVWYWMY